MALSALIFDVDGTLIDTNFAHVEAWHRAFAARNFHVSHDRIAVEVGKGGDKLIPSILGQQIADECAEELSAAHSEEFGRIAQSKRLPPFPGVIELFTEIRRRGIKTSLATSSKKKELAAIQKSARHDLTQLVEEIATADDAKESKPSPDIVAAAVKKLKLSPLQCAMAGDTPYDVHAARDAGVGLIGFSCGGINTAQTLRDAGARFTCRDPADLLRQLDKALETLSPGPAHLTDDLIHRLMRQAFIVATDGMNHGEAPIGCLLARGDGTIIAQGYNRLNASKSKTAHAEMVTFDAATGKVPADARDLILVSTLEPCVMCLGAAMEGAVDAIIYALPAPADGGTHRVRPPISPESQMPRILGNVLADESRALFEEFLPRANPRQRAFAEQLLKMVKDQTSPPR